MMPAETPDPETQAANAVVAEGAERFLEAFRRTVREVPAYRAILDAENLNPGQVRGPEDLTRLPLLDKQRVFGEHRLADLCVGGTLADAALVYSSSGHSGTFSFGVESREDLARGAAGLEMHLDALFGALERPTLLVNCLPMGVRIPTRTLPVAETSVRTDAIVAVLRALRHEFDQFILIGEHLLQKKVVDEGADADPGWEDLCVHVVTGAEFISESWRGYMAARLGVDGADPRQGMVGINMGLSELSVSIFRDTPRLARLRRRADEDPDLRREIFGSEARVTPEILQYDPRHTWLETVPDKAGRPELVVSTLDPERTLPLLRYRTGDHVALRPYADLREILERTGNADLLPPHPLPVGLIYGRNPGLDLPGGGRVTVADVKDVLYRDHEAARDWTGLFHLTPAEDGMGAVEIEAREGHPPSARAAEALEDRLAALVGERVPVAVRPYGRFQYGWGFNYERKPSYV